MTTPHRSHRPGGTTEPTTSTPPQPRTCPCPQARSAALPVEAPPPLALYVTHGSKTKLRFPAPAHRLYTGAQFRRALSVLRTQADLTARRDLRTRVLILSRHYGLLDPDTLIAPYEQPHTRTAALTPEALAAQLADLAGPHRHVTIHAYTTRAHIAVLRAAISKVTTDILVALEDTFATAHGIGYQNHLISQLRREQGQRMAEYGWRI